MQKIIHHYHKFRSRSAGLLLLRLAVAAIFFYAGWFKLTHIEMAAQGFSSMGLGVAMVWIVGLFETIGAMMIALGWWSKFWSSALFVIIVVAMITTKGFVIGSAIGNLQWLLLAALANIILSGCGRFSLCAWKHHKNCESCKSDSKCHCEHA